MAYTTLYRRYRPRRFSEVRGQEHVVRALRNAVRENRVGHAYLFTGPRGTGKTSAARILAKALNCEHLDQGEPDGTCESCLAIDAGTSYDVQELDAASNNKVEDIRDLIGRVALGSPGRTKVYILDEVHMLTAAASASLLKTLEEPPDHVVFVLATTDPQKVLDTIRSRTQEFSFHLLGADELAEHVAWVIHDAGLDLGADAIEYVVARGRGSARDTLSALDQVAAAGGVMDRGDTTSALLDAIAAGDAAGCLVAVNDAVAAGRDPRVLGEAVLARLRDVFLVEMGAATDHLPPGDIDKVRAWAEELGARATTRALELVGDALIEMRQAPDARIPLEVALVKLTRAGADVSLDALAERVASLEAALAGGAAPTPTATPASAATQAPQVAAKAAEPAPSDPEAPADGAPPLAAPGGRGRPADGARAQLAANRGTTRGGSATRPAPAPRSAAPPPPASAPPPPPSEVPAAAEVPQPVEAEVTAAAEGPASAAEPAPVEVPATVDVREPAPAKDELPAAPAAAGDLGALWSDQVIANLARGARAMYATATLVSVGDGSAVVAADNEHHRAALERKRPDAEQALSDALGRRVTIELVVGAERPGGGGSASAVASPAAPATDDDHLGGGDVHDLPDAPDASAGGLGALTEAFPGSELIEEH